MADSEWDVLAEDEQQTFIKQYQEELFSGVTSSAGSYPRFTIILGAQGAGKSTLSTSLRNTVVVSPDEVIRRLYKDLGYDLTQNNYDAQTGDFAMRVSYETMNKALALKYDIAYDAMSLSDLGNIFKVVKNFGYDFNIKAVIDDEYTSALNVEERKLQNNEEYIRYKQGKGRYPSGNPLEVSSQDSIISSMRLVDFLLQADKKNIRFEVYEPGKTEPAYVSRNGKNSFADYLENRKLCSAAEHEKRCEKLLRKAKEANNENAFLRLKLLQKEIRNL